SSITKARAVAVGCDIGLFGAGPVRLPRVHRNSRSAITLRNAGFLCEECIRARAAMFARKMPARLDRHPLTARLSHCHPGSAVISHVCSAGLVEVRERNCELSIGNLVNEKMHERRAVRSLP